MCNCGFVWQTGYIDIRSGTLTIPGQSKSG